MQSLHVVAGALPGLWQVHQDGVLAAGAQVTELKIPLGINLVAVFVGAIVGTLRAGESEDVDVVGMFGLALCFGFGGGIVRDILLGNLPPAALRTPVYILTVLAAAVIASVFLVYLDHLERPLWVMDSLSIGLFAAVGANAALLAGLPAVPAVFIGSLASVGGLFFADALQARPSAMLHRGPPNVMAGFAGAVVYVLTFDKISTVLVTCLAVGTAFAVRVVGFRYNVWVPMPNKAPLGIRDKVLDPMGLEPTALQSRVRTLWAKVGAHPRSRGGDQ